MATGTMMTITMMTTATFTKRKIMTTTVRRGAAVAVLKTEPAFAAATAMAGTDSNQQRTSKTVVVAIAVIDATQEERSGISTQKRK